MRVQLLIPPVTLHVGGGDGRARAEEEVKSTLEQSMPTDVFAEHTTRVID